MRSAADRVSLVDDVGSDDFLPVKSADRTLEVLEDLAGHGPASLTELAARLHFPKSSLHGILRTMEHRGWIELDVQRSLYSLGLRSLLVGASYVDGDMVVARTQGVLDELSAATEETVHLARLEGSDVVYMAKRESTHPLRMFSAIGRRLPAHATALGKAMLAQLPDAEVEDLLPAHLTPLTAHTPTSKRALLDSLADVRRDGYAVDNEEATVGLRCFAVALPFTRPSKDAISLSIPMARLDADRERHLVGLLLEHRAQLANQLSGSRLPTS